MFKYLLAASAVTIFGFGTVKAVSSASNSPTTAVSAHITSNTVAGNVVDQRLANNPTPTPVDKELLDIKLNKSRVLYLNDEVTYESSQRVANGIKKLQDSQEPIYLLINSPGGSVLDGATVISEMEASKAPVYTVCTGLCASMAAMIHSYGVKRYALDRAILMYHPASGGAQGQIPNMLSQITTITRYVDKMVANVVSRSKISKEDYDRLVAYELWIDSEDSLQRGLIDSIVHLDSSAYEDRAQSLALPPPDQQRNTPKRVKTPFRLEAPDNELSMWGIDTNAQ